MLRNYWRRIFNSRRGRFLKILGKIGAINPNFPSIYLVDPEKVIILLVSWMALLDLLSPSRKVRQDKAGWKTRPP